ncbi:type IV pili methyl-accepting chemotaxis transducer N-terminal domain-containing protein [Aurantibacter sp.]|uniref:type IV pili methyl-accepting chemotaxis transducer N-terminal domain-containing protein n=1 Tax=Aurantibacter sp. TaxID=2807103 RepID=UPI003267AFC2
MFKRVLTKLKLKDNFSRYYLLVFTVIVLTVVIQTIIQYSLSKQRQASLIINEAGKQRMLSQVILNSVYSCKYGTCDYGKLRFALNKINNTHIVLQKGSSSTGIPVLDNESIQDNFNKLQPNLNYITASLDDFTMLNSVNIEELTIEVNQFLEVMDNIVFQFQKASEEDIKTLMIIEMELAVFSLLILILEIFLIINPSFKKITLQNQKLKEINWHQTHAFNSHMKNIKDFNHILKIEKNLSHKEELITCLMEELSDLEGVSNNMVKSLEKQA